MKNSKEKIIFFFLYVCFLLQGCYFCIETPLKIKQAARMENQIPLSVLELKNMIYRDTLHYKVVIFYSPCCEPCMRHFRETYIPFIKAVDTSNVRFYFILEDCGGASLNENLLNRFQILPVNMYYLRDDTSDFSSKNDSKWNNITNYIFPCDTATINDIWGIPTTYIVSKNNCLKRCQNIYSGDSSFLVKYGACSLYGILDVNFDHINFNIIDNCYILGLPYCPPNGCKIN